MSEISHDSPKSPKSVQKLTGKKSENPFKVYKKNLASCSGSEVEETRSQSDQKSDKQSVHLNTNSVEFKPSGDLHSKAVYQPKNVAPIGPPTGMSITAPSFTPKNFSKQTPSPSQNPIAPPKFQGRPNNNFSNINSNFQPGLSPREKLLRGAASAGATMLEDSAPFRRKSPESFKSKPDDKPKITEKPKPDNDTADVCKKLENTDLSDTKKSEDGALNQLATMFSPEQALAIQAAIQSIMGKKDGSGDASDMQEAMIAAMSASQKSKGALKEKTPQDTPVNKQNSDLPVPQPSMFNPIKSKNFSAPSDASQANFDEYHSQYTLIGGSNTAGVPNYMLNQNNFSRKVFVGGLPPDIDEDEIRQHFSQYGKLSVDWPHKAESNRGVKLSYTVPFLTILTFAKNDQLL